MPKDNHPRKDRGDDHERRGDHKREEPPGERHHSREERQEHAAEQKIFGVMVQRRLGGGADPTAEAYAEAMQQWQKLPGAVQFVAVPKFPGSDSGSSGGSGKPTQHPPTQHSPAQKPRGRE